MMIIPGVINTLHISQTFQPYFTPLDYLLYLGAIVAFWVAFLQWKWTKTCKNNILVLIQRTKGNGDWMLSPISGNSITLKNQEKETSQVWAINQLSTIDVPYPGVGFIPQFMQKQIRMVVVSEDSWEPITNRSKDKEIVASPAFLGNLINEKITEAIITVNKEIVDAIKGMGKILNPTHFYIGVGLVIIMQAYIIMQVSPLRNLIETLKLALGL